VAALVTNVVPLNGLACRALLAAAGTPANGDTTATGTGTFLLAENTSAGIITITIATPQFVEGDLQVPGRAATGIPITTGLNIIPLTDVHRDPATGLSSLSYSATANLKVIVCRVP
jgi:hypothetical protein